MYAVMDEDQERWYERLDRWIDEKKKEASDKIFVNYGKLLHPSLVKSLAYATIQEEKYAMDFADMCKWTEDNVFAALDLTDRCEELFNEENEDNSAPDEVENDGRFYRSNWY